VTAAGSSRVSGVMNAGSPASPSVSFESSVPGIAPGWRAIDVTSGYSAMRAQVLARIWQGSGHAPIEMNSLKRPRANLLVA
jgi:hypothetical protein